MFKINEKGEMEACDETFGMAVLEIKKKLAYYQQAETEGRLTTKLIPDERPEMRVIYIAHPFSGDAKNVKKVEKIILGLIQEYPNCTFYSPLHNTGFFYHDISYEAGMEHCLEMLRRCDEIWFCKGWQKSRGCNIEHNWAVEHGMALKEVE